ncbi:hypothetical protein Ccrd_002959 [Cynara cardunculus var. scolymus]|uniref:Uncharacterized protein n=1 Tax=Cynara cardunculus var. scolymus TaxID=59895 RepID=A0A103XQC5_CYNCS|nr:hypothetical protein Ccrd_002959 [Cynara cardunculus var. scolymus]
MNDNDGHNFVGTVKNKQMSKIYDEFYENDVGDVRSRIATILTAGSHSNSSSLSEKSEEFWNNDIRSSNIFCLGSSSQLSSSNSSSSTSSLSQQFSRLQNSNNSKAAQFGTTAHEPD